ncbi:nitroreductase family deazaflavin-dependent oxidoreductase [Tsukamurella sp. 1534]|uniref:nitroreductase family deazaflavin-dependent oxidoreductase n=1 Tax=Tsukamurella sp. 1534 TaxID=1151061 RepID=UPI0003010024|nr:nitroreductase family deazaflavin-dependent oxidoreductase [Tsukamurella sp. 1534]
MEHEDTDGDRLSYTGGDYRPERFRRLGSIQSPGTKRLITTILKVVHRPWFAVRMPDGVAELTTIGRRSGLPRSTFVRAYRVDARVFLVSIAGEQALWAKNIRADPSVTLRFRGNSVSGSAREPADDERRIAERAFCGRVTAFDYLENAFHRTGVPSAAKVRELHRAWLRGGTLFVVDVA